MKEPEIEIIGLFKPDGPNEPEIRIKWDNDRWQSIKISFPCGPLEVSEAFHRASRFILTDMKVSNPLHSETLQ